MGKFFEGAWDHCTGCCCTSHAGPAYVPEGNVFCGTSLFTCTGAAVAPFFQRAGDVQGRVGGGGGRRRVLGDAAGRKEPGYSRTLYFAPRYIILCVKNRDELPLGQKDSKSSSTFDRNSQHPVIHGPCSASVLSLGLPALSRVPPPLSMPCVPSPTVDSSFSVSRFLQDQCMLPCHPCLCSVTGLAKGSFSSHVQTCSQMKQECPNHAIQGRILARDMGKQGGVGNSKSLSKMIRCF